MLPSTVSPRVASEPFALHWLLSNEMCQKHKIADVEDLSTNKDGKICFYNFLNHTLKVDILVILGYITHTIEFHDGD